MSLNTSHLTVSRILNSEVITTFLQDTDYSEGQGKLRNLLTWFHEIIMLPEDPHGSTTLVQHHIPQKSDTSPVYIPAYRFRHSQCQVLDKIVKEMLEQDVIEPFNSPWNFSMFLVPKKDGRNRSVIIPGNPTRNFKRGSHYPPYRID